jgi:hypothetical protein
MITEFLMTNIFAAALLAVILYYVSHILNMWDIFLYAHGGKDVIEIEGNDRLMDKYLKPDRSIRWLHSRFIGILAVISIGLPAAWWSLTDRLKLAQVYVFLLGGFCL